MFFWNVVILGQDDRKIKCSRDELLWGSGSLGTQVLPVSLTSASWNFPGSGAPRMRFFWDEVILDRMIPDDTRIRCSQDKLFPGSGSPRVRLSRLLSLPSPGWNFPLITSPRGKERSPGLGKGPRRVLGTGGRVRTVSPDQIREKREEW